VLPGWIDTSDPARSGGNSLLRPEDHAWHWAGRVGVPADVAEMVGFLADGSKSGFITGQEFVVDGGSTKRMTYPD
jgi:NAD(P)-dependent dehydrogenase (short-subunit alcohol dehydrogenase family)